MKKAFVFFTSKENLITAPIVLLENDLLDFDNKKIISLSKSKTPTDEQNELRYFVLISDSITLQNPLENTVEEQGNSKDLFGLLNGVDEIYLVIHKNKQSNYLDTFQRLFKGKIKSYIIHSHVTDSIYYRVLKPALGSNSGTDLSSFETALLREFPNNQLESIIHLRKSLSLIPIKLKNGAFTNEGLETELSSIQSAKKDKVAFAFQKYKAGEITTDNFNEKLTSIAEEIKTLSASG